MLGRCGPAITSFAQRIVELMASLPRAPVGSLHLLRFGAWTREDRVHRRRAGRALFRDLDEAARSGARDRPLRAQPRPTTRSAGASSSPTRRSRICMANDPSLRRDHPTNSPIGTISRSTSTARRSARAATASRHRPQAAARHPPGARARARRRPAFRAEASRRLADWGDAIWSSPPTAPTAASATLRRRFRARRRGARATSSSGSARRKVFDAFTFAFEQTEPGWFRAHAYRFDDDSRPSSSRCPETWRRAGLDRDEQDEAIALCERMFAKYLDGHALHVQRRATCAARSAWLNFRRSSASAWCTKRQPRSCSATPPTPPISRSARAPSSRWRMRSSSPTCCNRPRPRDCDARSPNIRRSEHRGAASSRTAPATRPNGSRRRPLPPARPSSSPIPCSPAASA